MANFDPYAVPKEVLGYLDWFSGTLFVNETLETWRNLQGGKNSGNSDRVALLESVTHETYHFLQIATTGFPFQMACLMFRELKELVKPPVDASRLLALVQSPPKPTRPLIFLAQFLDEKGPGEVSTRDIIESSAYLYQHRVYRKYLSLSTYETLLEEKQPRREYRHAYDVAQSVLEERVFPLFLPVCFAALCCAEPNLAFLEIVRAARDVADLGPCTNTELVRKLCAYVGGRHGLLGSASEVAFGGTSPFGSLYHPIFSEAVAALQENVERLNPIDLVCSPGVLDTRAWESIIWPVLLQGGALWLPPAAFRRRQEDESLRVRVEALVKLGAIGIRIAAHHAITPVN